MDDLHIAIRVLENHYRDQGQGRGMEYTYGYMDALAALREVASASVRGNGHPYSYTEYDKAISDTTGHI